MNSDIVWHELFDRMHNDQCPICELIHNRTERSMDSLLYESVNDTTVRNKICSSNGLCNFHAFMLMDMGDPLAHALIYNDLLNKAIHYIKAPNIKSTYLYQLHEECLFCQQERESEKIYIKTFITAFGDTEFKAKYNDSGLLCMPHLELIIYSKEKINIKEIKEITLQKYQSLINQLLEIERKNDYRFSHEPWSKQEKSAWKRAVSVINAQRGLKN